MYSAPRKPNNVAELIFSLEDTQIQARASCKLINLRVFGAELEWRDAVLGTEGLW